MACRMTRVRWFSSSLRHTARPFATTGQLPNLAVSGLNNGGWFDTTFRLSDTPSPSARSESFPHEVYAIVRGVNAPLKMHPGGNSVRLPVCWDEFVHAISVPLWDTVEKECEESKLGGLLYVHADSGQGCAAGRREPAPYGGPTIITRRCRAASWCGNAFRHTMRMRTSGTYSRCPGVSARDSSVEDTIKRVHDYPCHR